MTLIPQGLLFFRFKLKRKNKKSSGRESLKKNGLKCLIGIMMQSNKNRANLYYVNQVCKPQECDPVGKT